MCRVNLRRIIQQDTPVFERLFSDSQVMEFSDGVMSADGVRRWCETAQSQYCNADGFATFSVWLPESNQVIGYCSLHLSAHTQEPEVGYRILPEFWGRSLAFEAVNLILEYPFNELKLSKVGAQIDPHNKRSLNLARRFNMEFTCLVKPDWYDYADEVWVVSKDKFTQ